jgi:NAD(P)-dependent dehydrogenase (short-subunit alcohol dehydrogenase family)
MSKKVILVTGASAGIGGECADRLQQSGWTVVGASRRGTSSGSWQGMTMNVDDDASVNQGITDILAEHGRIDAVLASAGWGLAGAAEQTPILEAKAQIETIFWGAVRVVNATLPIFRRQGGGRIVLMSSMGGQIGIPFQAFYSAGKFALEGFAESLAYEVEPFGVHVTLVEPGNFKTDFTESRIMVPVSSDDPYAKAREKAIVTMERDEVHGAHPRDVARVVERVLGAAKPPRRVSVGKFAERVGLIAKRLMPFALFEKSARGSLGV